MTHAAEDSSLPVQVSAERLRRAPGVTILARDDTALQFGLDATRCGIVAVDNAAAVAAALRALPKECGRHDLLTTFLGASLPPTAAIALVDELVDFGVWQPARGRDHIALIGGSPLAKALEKKLWRDNFSVFRFNTADAPEPVSTFMSRHGHNVPLLVVDEQATAHSMSLHLHTFARTWLPIMQLDQRILIGPLHVDDRGPCPLCLNLYRTEIDPEWRTVLEAATRMGAPDILVTDAAVAYAVAAARTLVKRPGLPGAADTQWHAGTVLDVDIFGGNQRSVYPNHPRCPVCFSHVWDGGKEDGALYRKQVSAPY